MMRHAVKQHGKSSLYKQKSPRIIVGFSFGVPKAIRPYPPVAGKFKDIVYYLNINMLESATG